MMIDSLFVLKVPNHYLYNKMDKMNIQQMEMKNFQSKMECIKFMKGFSIGTLQKSTADI